MKEKSNESSKPWVDPDDAPELTEDFFENAQTFIGGKPVSKEEFKQAYLAKKRGRPVAETTKDRITIRLSPEVVDYFKGSGKGWQTRMDQVLKDYVEEHSGR